MSPLSIMQFKSVFVKHESIGDSEAKLTVSHSAVTHSFIEWYLLPHVLHFILSYHFL